MAINDTKHYLYKLKYYMIVGSILFIFSTIIGYLVAEYLRLSILGELEGSFQWAVELDPFTLMLFVFLNNSIKSLFAILLGFFFAIIPLLFVTINGLLIGMIFFDAVKEKGLAFILSAILPHGIIEMPIFLLSVAIGLRMGVQTVLKLDGKDVKLKSELKNGLRFFILYILPLFLLSAFIEAFITPLFINITS
ncbi:MAG: stage II sporulation protein M [archaeon]|nr:stage II sporulation protein M [archaeon]MCP8316258.1 stage II sporulation protein M [archaeon]